jgi:hypothetical protein
MEKLSCNRFLTLTWRPTPGATRDEELTGIRHAWKSFRKRLKRYHAPSQVSFCLIVEFTKAGAPHLHVLLNCPYTPQKWCSANWSALTNSPIVDIRAVRNVARAAKYLTKYLTKDIAVPSRHHKYSASPGWLPPKEPKAYAPDEEHPIWSFSPYPISYGMSALLRGGWVAYEDGPDSYVLVSPLPCANSPGITPSPSLGDLQRVVG